MTGHLPETSLACEDLSVRFDNREALKQVSLALPRGSIYALLGRNGAGKSTLVSCLLGQRRPDAGHCFLFGQEAWKGRAQAMLRTGVVPEQPDLPLHMSAAALSAFSASLYERWDGAGLKARLERFQVPFDQPAGQLSRGQKAQLSLALALGSHPKLLILDDPTLGLDAVARRDFYQELLGELADEGTTVLLTSHDLQGVESIADRVGFLREGRLVADEPLEDLKARHRMLRWDGRDLPSAALSGLAAGPVRHSAWGAEVLLGRYEEDRFASLQEASGGGLAADPLSLEDLFISLAGAVQEIEA